MALADSAQRELAAKPTQNLAAYDAYLRGEAASQAMGVSRSGEPPPGDRLLRAGGGARLDVRARPGPSSPGRTPPVRQQRARPGVGARRPGGGGAGTGARPRGADGLPALGDVLCDRGGSTTARALAEYEAGLRLAPDNAELLGSVASAESAWAAGKRRSASRGAVPLDPRSANAAAAPRRLHCSGCGATPKPIGGRSCSHARPDQSSAASR